jgi:hypothetical protein
VRRCLIHPYHRQLPDSRLGQPFPEALRALKALATLCAIAGLASFSHAAIYSQSFDYGDSPLDFGSDLSGDGWSGNTGTIDYVPGAGLNYTGLVGRKDAHTLRFIPDSGH